MKKKSNRYYDKKVILNIGTIFNSFTRTFDTFYSVSGGRMSTHNKIKRKTNKFL